ncbi:P-loop containing nucleoside triphosphate hydrolase protein [Xylaria sp. CBS 124048]|nr:P-loop containing nucleoside triphosphate hydrolase protein [Xylaria sp. CBS 124048]
MGNPTSNPESIGSKSTPVTSGTPHAEVGCHGATKPRHIWLVAGPAGCGKTTVAKYLSTTLELPYVEGDLYHPEANIKKMSDGIPLTDADRWDWLTLLREESVKKLASGVDGVVVTCSALKRKYRDVIRVAPYFSRGIVVHFIYLQASEAMLLARVSSRQGHYMGANMVRSQFEILEPPMAEETDVISIDVSGSITEVCEEVLRQAKATINKAV